MTAPLQEKLQNLPYGLEGQQSLFLRYRHVDSVHFTGSATQSTYGFRRGQSIMNEGLSLKLTQSGKSGWASGVIQLQKPMDVRRYNSILLWVWCSRPAMRLSVGLKDGMAARSDALPRQGFPAAEPVQLVVPMSRLIPRNKVDLSEVSEVFIEFGSDVTANKPQGTIQVLGVAFVEQANLPKRAMMVLGRATSRLVLAEPTKEHSSEEFNDKPETVKKIRVAAAPVESPLAEAVVSENPQVTEIPMPRPVVVPQNSWIEKRDSNRSRPPDVFYLLFVLALGAFWYAINRRKIQGRPLEPLGKVFHEIHWPFSMTQAVLHRKIEREFWRGVAAQQERYVWLSTTGLVLERSNPSEYYGESFLRRQIQLASKAGIRLFPSLSFTQIFLRKEAISFERSSLALRSLVVDTLLRFAEIAPGVRIENAKEFFDAQLRRRSRAIAVDDNDARENSKFFWADVISDVRARFPNFLFVADSIAEQSRAVREMGFNYYENDLLVRTVLDQIQTGKVGDLSAFLRGESAHYLRCGIYNLNSLFKPFPSEDFARHQNVLAAILLTLLPGVVQHDNNMPEEVAGFINRLARASVIRKGKFLLLKSSNPEVLAFARWRKKSLLVAVANFSNNFKNESIQLRSLLAGFENNKLYLFTNALHGSVSIKSLLNQPESGGPAVALWGQNLRDTGLPLAMPPLSLGLFSVNLTKPITSVFSPVESEADVFSELNVAQ